MSLKIRYQESGPDGRTRTEELTPEEVMDRQVAVLREALVDVLQEGLSDDPQVDLLAQRLVQMASVVSQVHMAARDHAARQEMERREQQALMQRVAQQQGGGPGGLIVPGG